MRPPTCDSRNWVGTHKPAERPRRYAAELTVVGVPINQTTSSIVLGTPSEDLVGKGSDLGDFCATLWNLLVVDTAGDPTLTFQRSEFECTSTTELERRCKADNALAVGPEG